MTKKRNIEAERVEKLNRNIFRCREIELDNLSRLRIRFGDRTVDSIKLSKIHSIETIEKKSSRYNRIYAGRKITFIDSFSCRDVEMILIKYVIL